MSVINKILPVSAESLFIALKNDFAVYVNSRLGSNIAIEYAHVQNIINITFAELIEVTTFTITVGEDSLLLSTIPGSGDYNTELLEQHLSDFLTEKVS